MEQNILGNKIEISSYNTQGEKNRKLHFLFLRNWIIIVLFCLATSNVLAQQNLEFVENKGQWDNNIAFKGELNNGAFVLKPDGGYRILQYNPNSLDQLNELIHPHSGVTNTSENNQPKEGNNSFPKQTKNISGEFTYTLTGNVHEIKFVNGNLHPQAIPDKPLESYNNYMLGKDKSKWAGNCAIYTAVTFKNIYPNIDIHYYTDKGNLKYDFIVNPGGNVNDILLYVEGAESISIKQGQLVIKSPAGEIRESIPSCFEFNTKTGKKDIECNFKLSGNLVRFSITQALSPNATLIIDPQFVFCSFTGSTSSNWGYTATYDNSGNFYAGGIVFGTGFPVSNGAYQTTFNGGNENTGEGGGFDIGIMKFNSLGNRKVYATYLGGNGNDYPHSLVVDNNNNLIVSGKTTSPNFPSTEPHYGPGNAGETFDIILTKFNAAGTGIIGSRVIGGSGNDGVNIGNKFSPPSGPISLRLNYGDDSRSEVIIDSLGNIYLASCTQSVDFPVTNNAFQKTPGAATASRFQDAVIFKTTPNLSTILVSSFLGGNGDDAAYILAIDPITNQLLVGGGTASSNLPGDTTNVIYPTQKGNIDGFISLISSDGSALLKTTYIGTNGEDLVYGVQYDKNGFPYIMGTTTGVWPIINAPFSQSGGKQYIAKLKKDLSGFIYSTTFGTNRNYPNISPTAFLVDRCENVYVSGWGGLGNTSQKYNSSGTIGLTVTNGAIKSKTDGSDFYFFVLKRDAVGQLYGSFFGQDNGKYPDHVDGGTSRFDNNGVIYQSVCANCGGGAIFPTTPGAAFPSNGSRTGCNLAAIKIAFNLAGIGASIRSSIKGTIKRSGCVPLSVNFIDQIAEGKTYYWDFGDGTPRQTTTVPQNNHTYTKIGTFLAMLISEDNETCNKTDTSYQTIKVGENQARLNITAKKDLTGGCASTTYIFNNLSTSINTTTNTSGLPFKANSFTIDFGDGTKQQIGSPQTFSHTYPSTGTYNASLLISDENYCNAPDSVPIVLRIAENVKAIIKGSPIVCVPNDAFFENASLAGESFTWDFGDGTIYTGNDIYLSHTYTNVGAYTVKLTAIDSSTCNIKSDTTFKLITKVKPTADFSYSPNPSKENQPFVFNNLSSSDAISFKWIFDDGDTLITTSRAPITHQYIFTKTYRVSLIATNIGGCSDTTQQDLRSLVAPLVDVANAIAPYGNNKTVQVRGYGIENIKWRIYNRWGQVIFETTDKNQAWDGRYKGQLQAPDVYIYTLDVEFTDGTKYSKKGDITLLK